MTVETIFPSLLPDNSAGDSASPRALGFDFKAAVLGTISSGRYYVTPLGTIRPATVRLSIWDPSTSTVTPLATGTVSVSGTGWKAITLGSTVTITAGHVYTVSVDISLSASSGQPEYGFTNTGLASDVVSGNIRALAGTGKFHNSEGASPTYPDNAAANFNFFPDVDFIAGGTENAVLTGTLPQFTSAVTLTDVKPGTENAVLAGTLPQFTSAVRLRGPGTSDVGGGWYSLLAISREAREIANYYATTVPMACPRCGEPLTPAPGGAAIRRCRWDGWEWPRDGR